MSNSMFSRVKLQGMEVAERCVIATRAVGEQADREWICVHNLCAMTQRRRPYCAQVWDCQRMSNNLQEDMTTSDNSHSHQWFSDISASLVFPYNRKMSALWVPFFSFTDALQGISSL